MIDISQIQEHMEVVGSDGEHVGIVDGIEDNQLKLTRTDPSAGGQHHYIPIDMIASADGAVQLTMTAAQARAEWITEGV